jgi:hypothetical protein
MSKQSHWMNGEEVLAVRVLFAALGCETTHDVLGHPGIGLNFLERDGTREQCRRLAALAIRGRIATLTTGCYGHVAGSPDPVEQTGVNLLAPLDAAFRRSTARCEGRKTSRLPDWQIDKWGDEPLLDLRAAVEEVVRRHGADPYTSIVLHEIDVSLREEEEWRRKAAAVRVAEEAETPSDAPPVIN